MGMKERRRNNICTYWLAGKCRRNPCKFLHGEPQPQRPERKRSMVWKNSNVKNSKVLLSPATKVTGSVSKELNSIQKEEICKFWLLGKCNYGDRCRKLHSWFKGKGFSMLGRLEGHMKPITGISLPLGDTKLYSASSDGSVRIWDCHSAQCIRESNTSHEFGPLISEGSWVFLGMTNVVKAWNFQTGMEVSLNGGPFGKVYALATSDDMLFGATQSGGIWVWKACGSDKNPFEFVGVLKGHTSTVVSLFVGCGGKKLFSGSMDKTIRFWDLERLVCIDTLVGHSDVVMSLLCWDNFLISGSLDREIKIWAMTEEGNLKVTYTHKVSHGILALGGMTDSKEKPVLFCSCNDISVRIYELPSFLERGRLFAREEVRVIEIGPNGLFFTGDAAGLVTAWKWIDEPQID
ncbi:hypothetical protein L6164_037253 [Bauhinia variegata]|uniref:Uncharacterized protein n=1 Tax=Bauhinia variegata TaxID=167791 RepID=A0ACB9KJJ3_BAUVA|nr:hypothetical protein L6164_037253 [Bauhinia variegata]